MFSSKRFDKETGLINFGRRCYDPTLGRFVTADPSGFADGPNLYAYCGGDPVNLIDPDGQLSKSFAPSWTSSSPNINYSFTDGMYGAFSGMQALAGAQVWDRSLAGPCRRLAASRKCIWAFRPWGQGSAPWSAAWPSFMDNRTFSVREKFKIDKTIEWNGRIVVTCNTDPESLPSNILKQSCPLFFLLYQMRMCFGKKQNDRDACSILQ